MTKNKATELETINALYGATVGESVRETFEFNGETFLVYRNYNVNDNLIIKHPNGTKFEVVLKPVSK